MMERKICVIEDDQKLCDEIVYFLNTNGFTARAAKQEEYNAKALLQGGFSMLLLDISLPGTDGLFLCREMRKESEIPIIIITSNNMEITELMAMNCGADDFVTKPFNPQILLARMEVILKRVYKNTESDNRFYLNGFVFDSGQGTIQNGEKKADLTKNEVRILMSLAKKRGEIVSREEIIEKLWENHLFVDDNTLTVNMTRLKNKLEEIGIKDMIMTKRGMGYQLL
ncbi:MAG: response regulator transcription factor [Lachnospiraceae bacterium]|nr:response regulator transcription factor [Lachnospiraceae bacterium]